MPFNIYTGFYSLYVVLQSRKCFLTFYALNSRFCWTWLTSLF